MSQCKRANTNVQTLDSLVEAPLAGNLASTLIGFDATRFAHLQPFRMETISHLTVSLVWLSGLWQRRTFVLVPRFTVGMVLGR